MGTVDAEPETEASEISWYNNAAECLSLTTKSQMSNFVVFLKAMSAT